MIGCSKWFPGRDTPEAGASDAVGELKSSGEGVEIGERVEEDGGGIEVEDTVELIDGEQQQTTMPRSLIASTHDMNLEPDIRLTHAEMQLGKVKFPCVTIFHAWF